CKAPCRGELRRLDRGGIRISGFSNVACRSRRETFLLLSPRTACILSELPSSTSFPDEMGSSRRPTFSFSGSRVGCCSTLLLRSHSFSQSIFLLGASAGNSSKSRIFFFELSTSPPNWGDKLASDLNPHRGQ